jgi:hypothetical protein
MHEGSGSMRAPRSSLDMTYGRLKVLPPPERLQDYSDRAYGVDKVGTDNSRCIQHDHTQTQAPKINVQPPNYLYCSRMPYDRQHDL